jgi:hypothetical protein
MSFNIQQMMLISSNKEIEIFTVTVNTNYSTTFSITYEGSMNVNFGDGVEENLNSSEQTIYNHTYNS